MSYASQYGYRPATRAEKIARGFKPSSRAYTPISGGEVISHRQLQTTGIIDRYGNIDRRTALEERAYVRREELGIRSARATFDHMVHRMAITSIDKGGLGAKYNTKTHTYTLPTGERIGFQELARSEEFRHPEVGVWEQWQRIRHQPGPQGERQRFNFLRQYGFLRNIGHGKFRYIR